jgi:site-specific recombinase XerD
MKTQLDSAWLFPDADGGQIAKNGYREALDSAFVTTGIKGRDFYTFRHAHCTHWLTAGGDVITLAHLTGTSAEMIAKTYGQLDIERVREVQARMSGKSARPTEIRERPRIQYAQCQPSLRAIS